MIIERTEVKISLSIREAQSLKTILMVVNDCDRNGHHKAIAFNSLPKGMFDDVKEIERELNNLLRAG